MSPEKVELAALISEAVDSERDRWLHDYQEQAARIAKLTAMHADDEKAYLQICEQVKLLSADCKAKDAEITKLNNKVIAERAKIIVMSRCCPEGGCLVSDEMINNSLDDDDLREAKRQLGEQP